jgi:oligopeptide transport system permease protein
VNFVTLTSLTARINLTSLTTSATSATSARKTAKIAEGGAEAVGFEPDDFEFAAPAEEGKEEIEVWELEFREESAFSRLFKNRGSAAAFFCVLALSFMAAVGPVISGFRYDQQVAGHDNMAPRIPGLEKLGVFDGSETMKTSRGALVVNKYERIEGGKNVYHWFGTDVLGRDLFTRTWEGTRISLFIAFTAVLIDMVFGVTYGLVSGYFGGRTDLYMQRFVEVLNGIPNLIIVTLLILVLRPGLTSIVIALIMTGWIGMSRVARSQIIKLKEQEFILASKTLGAGHFFLIFRDILPNIFAQLLIMSMFSIPNAIFSEAFLAFIGIGIPVPLASLGSIIADSFKSLTTHPYMIAFPVTVLALLMLSFNLLADGLRDALDPRMKNR